MITSITVQAILFGVIIASFIVLWAVAIKPFVLAAFRKHPKHEAVIIPFARQERRGGRHV
jgi:hypothetical protein